MAEIDQQFILLQKAIAKGKGKCLEYLQIEQAFGKFWRMTVAEVHSYDAIIGELQVLLKAGSGSLTRDLNAWIEKHSGLYPIEHQEGQKASLYAGFLKMHH